MAKESLHGDEEIVAVEDALRSAERSLVESERWFEQLVAHSKDIIAVIDEHGTLVYANPSSATLMGYEKNSKTGRTIFDLIHPDDHAVATAALAEIVNRTSTSMSTSEPVVIRILNSSNEWRFIEAELTNCLDDPAIRAVVANGRDITEERALASQLSFQASHDSLTGLANRMFFDDRLLKAHEVARRNGSRAAIFLLDLDDFKGVNDTYGHMAGDVLLVDFAKRLEAVSRSTDTLCRFGGDEFLYLAESLTDVGEVDHIAKRLLDALNAPFTVVGLRYSQKVSIGVAVWDGTETNTDGFLRDADIALYEAKRRGKARYVIFTQSMGVQAVNRFELTRELRDSLESGELSVQYQPIVDLDTLAIVGFESLTRWQHPTRGWIEPELFIPLAEESDLILEIGTFALREAIREASSWHSSDPTVSAPFVTVNMSARQFLDPAFISLIEENLTKQHLAPERLVIEITEGVALLDIADTMHVVDHLRRMNVDIAHDDFGTGYSSFSYLTSLNPRIVKIDKSLVHPEQENSKSDTLLEAIISLGAKLNMTMIAEGIETTASSATFAVSVVIGDRVSFSRRQSPPLTLQPCRPATLRLVSHCAMEIQI